MQQQKLADGVGDVIDRYAATSPPEFFAVVTETFFEKSPPARAPSSQAIQTI